MGQQPAPEQPMAWRGLAVPRYNKRRKRLQPAMLKVLNDEQAKIVQDPTRGERKRGALSDVWVVKFEAANDQYLVAYAIDEARHAVVFYDVGQHENFYRDLTKYLRAAFVKRGGEG